MIGYNIHSACFVQNLIAKIGWKTQPKVCGRHAEIPNEHCHIEELNLFISNVPSLWLLGMRTKSSWLLADGQTAALQPGLSAVEGDKSQTFVVLNESTINEWNSFRSHRRSSEVFNLNNPHNSIFFPTWRRSNMVLQSSLRCRVEVQLKENKYPELTKPKGHCCTHLVCRYLRQIWIYVFWK